MENFAFWRPAQDSDALPQIDIVPGKRAQTERATADLLGQPTNIFSLEIKWVIRRRDDIVFTFVRLACERGPRF